MRGYADMRECRHDTPAEATDQAPARKAPGRAARGRGLVLRAEAGRIPDYRLRRRRLAHAAVAERPADGPLLPGAAFPARALRAGRRADHPRWRGRGLRGAPEPHPPGRLARADAGRADAGAP